MITGFDYGTSNCAIGVLDESTNNVRLVNLQQNKAFMPSTLYALDRELISEYVGLNIVDEKIKQNFIKSRSTQLSRANSVRRHEGFSLDEQTLYFGKEAFEEYLSLPSEGYFVKSPKSFLGASGLRPESVQFFEDIVSAMMLGIKARAETQLGQEITHTVIGRPVNFQGLNSEKSNKQAVDILTIAAKRAGFKYVEFLFEPIAAGLNFEEQLLNNKTVLVVDVGGGTTDCAMVRMGPDHKIKTDRHDDFIGHSGERIGGNDLDVQVAGKHLMPLFGMESQLKNGLRMPTQPFWDAVRTNDVGAQTAFNERKTGLHLEQLLRDTTEPERFKQFIQIRNDKQNHHIVRSAEQAKISLSSNSQVAIDLSYISDNASINITELDFSEYIARPLEKITDLMGQAIQQAGCQPDLIYVTGGSAQSPVIRKAIEQTLGKIEVLDGDHFGSVAAGLTVWANRIFA